MDRPQGRGMGARGTRHTSHYAEEIRGRHRDNLSICLLLVSLRMPPEVGNDVSRTSRLPTTYSELRRKREFGCGHLQRRSTSIAFCSQISENPFYFFRFFIIIIFFNLSIFEGGSISHISCLTSLRPRVGSS